MATKETTAKISYTFKNGVEIKGSLEQILKTADSFGEKVDFSTLDLKSVPRGYYPSETKGLTPIKDMNDYHIRRALVKRAKDYYAGVFKTEDSNSQFLYKFTNMADDSIVFDLFKELSSRK